MCSDDMEFDFFRNCKFIIFIDLNDLFIDCDLLKIKIRGVLKENKRYRKCKWIFFIVIELISIISVFGNEFGNKWRRRGKLGEKKSVFKKMFFIFLV